MKKIIVLLISSLFLVLGYAQNHQPAEIKAMYRYTSIQRHVAGHDFEHNDDMILLASSVGSRFFSARTEQYDSLMSVPGGKEKYQELLKYAARNALVIENGGITFDRSKVNIPSMGEQFQVTRPDNSNDLTIIDFAAQENFIYQVPTSDLEWVIGDSVKTVLGYECQIATADYHGRKWTAWFSADVPVSAGPWQLMGLPGLIMEAETDGGEYKFEITALERTNQSILPRPGLQDYTKTTRKDFRKFQREIDKNPEKAYPEGNVKIVNSEESSRANMAHDLIETDY